MTDTVLIHGMLADRRVWRDVTPALSGPCHLVELPSHGEAPPWDGGDYQAQALGLAQAQCRAPVHLVGHSFGASVALRVAVEQPQMLASLTLIEPVFFYAARQKEPAAYDAYCDRMGPMAEAMQARDWTRAAAHFLGAWGVPGSWDAMPPPMRAAIAEKMPLVDASAASLMDDTGGIWPRLGAITCPVLIVTGDRSEPVMRAISAALQGKLPAAREVSIKGAGHMIPMTHGVQLGHEIAAFVG